MRSLRTLPVAAALLCLPAAARGQGVPQEITELRQRVATIRRNLPAITETAEYAADLFTRDTSLRFLVSLTSDPGMRLEFYWHNGGPPDTGNADDPANHGMVLLAVRSWDGSGVGTARLIEQMHALGRPVITFGPAVGKPTLPTGSRFIDNGAADGSATHLRLNALADIVAAWTFYTEFVAAATRRGWQPGVYLSSLLPGHEQFNDAIHFHMPAGAGAVPAIPAGRLGGQYLAAIDSIAEAAARPAHLAQVRAAVDSLRAARRGGARLFVASCAHFIQEDMQRDTVDSPFRPVDWRWDVVQKLRSRGARAGDAMIWFGYHGYDCPQAEVAKAFAEVGVRVTLVSDLPAPGNAPGHIVAYVPLVWKMPDAAARLPFLPGQTGPTASVDMVLHYLWLQRLLKEP